MNTEFELAKKANMSTLVDYPKDAFVSKTPINRELGAVFRMLLKRGKSLKCF